ncbi:MAG: C40 family peptidase [Clostridia bacterium]|nr:C40 family peptidase [Clostridia bacterium]MBQ6803262.1 C40 family peptidase [Clostridia bacterium]
MNSKEAILAWALSRVGNPYLMGGTGQFCTPSYRKARARQYPQSAEKIKKNCQRMRGEATSCKGCRYYDEAAGTGKRAYDCAQLTRWAMDSIGISLVSGATSQWNKTAWARKGDISTLPAASISLVFRQDSPTVMGHVGLYLGDGIVVHAKGHDDGVVRETLASYGRFTHWGIPKGLEEKQSSPPDTAALFQSIRSALNALEAICQEDSHANG